MMTKYIYKWTPDEDYNEPDNNYIEETDYIICESPYDFGDWLNDSGINFDQDGDTYYVIEDGYRTGEAYMIVSVVIDPDVTL